MFEGHVIRYVKGVFCDDARWDTDELGVGAVVEKQVVAKIFLSAFAKVACATRCGVERDDTIAWSEIDDVRTDLNDGSGKLMAKQRWGYDHARVISAAKNLQVRSAGEGRADPDNQLPRSRLGDGHAFDAHVFASMENRGPHGCCHQELPTLLPHPS
jgi:hypothetical protein